MPQSAWLDNGASNSALCKTMTREYCAPVRITGEAGKEYVKRQGKGVVKCFLLPEGPVGRKLRTPAENAGRMSTRRSAHDGRIRRSGRPGDPIRGVTVEGPRQGPGYL